MLITSYSFGKIIIDGNRYCKDIKIVNSSVNSSWWRKEGHKLLLSDIPELQEFIPGVLLIGMGYFGLMKISNEVKDYCDKNGVEIFASDSKRVVERFNEIEDKSKIIAVYHLTC